MKKIRKNIKLAKVVSSNFLHNTLLLDKNRGVTACLSDFLTGLLLIDTNKPFSEDQLRVIFKKRFPRLFNNTTFKGKVIQPFKYFFNILQSNFYSKHPIIKQVQNNLYIVNHIQSQFNIFSPHISLYKVSISDETINNYKGNLTNLSKDCAWLCLEKLVKSVPECVFTYKLIKQIFGLSRQDVKNYLKLSHGYTSEVYRTIGKLEQHDLELDNNILNRKNYKFIRGFKIIINKPLEHSLNIEISDSALLSIKDRLEKEAYRYSIANTFRVYLDTNVPNMGLSACGFHQQYERLGFLSISTLHARISLKKYIEAINLGFYKVKQNIYNYLSKNFNHEKAQGTSFSSIYNSLCTNFIYQY